MTRMAHEYLSLLNMWSQEQLFGGKKQKGILALRICSGGLQYVFAFIDFKLSILRGSYWEEIFERKLTHGFNII